MTTLSAVWRRCRQHAPAPLPPLRHILLLVLLAVADAATLGGCDRAPPPRKSPGARRATAPSAPSGAPSPVRPAAPPTTDVPVAPGPAPAAVPAPTPALSLEERERDPASDMVTIKIVVEPPRPARVFWGAKDLGQPPLEIQRPRGSGPLDLIVRAAGYLTLHTRAFTDRDDKINVRLTPESDAPRMLGYRPP